MAIATESLSTGASERWTSPQAERRVHIAGSKGGADVIEISDGSSHAANPPKPSTAELSGLERSMENRLGFWFERGPLIELVTLKLCVAAHATIAGHGANFRHPLGDLGRRLTRWAQDVEWARSLDMNHKVKTVQQRP